LFWLLLFAFCLLNIDFFWSQFLTIWYANLPEETFYLIERTIDTHTVEADRPFTVRFVGSEEGQVSVTSDANVVLKGSIGRRKSVPSFAGSGGDQLRERLIESGILRVDGDHFVFEKDYLFPSPSRAAMTLMGRTSNGWVDWKTKDGRTLDEVKRQGNEA